MGTVVEFAGLPGAGKTFLAEGLTGRLAAAGRTVTAVSRPALGRRRRAILIGSLLSRHPRFAARTARALGRPGRMKDLLRLWVNWMISQALVEEGLRRAGVTVLDQGPIQLLWSVGVRADPRVAGCAAVVRESPGSDLLVVVSVPVEVARRRLEARGSPALPSGELEHGRKVLGSILESLPGRATVTLENDDSGSVDEVLAPVLAAVSLTGPAPTS